MGKVKSALKGEISNRNATYAELGIFQILEAQGHLFRAKVNRLLIWVISPGWGTICDGVSCYICKCTIYYPWLWLLINIVVISCWRWRDWFHSNLKNNCECALIIKDNTWYIYRCNNWHVTNRAPGWGTLIYNFRPMSVLFVSLNIYFSHYYNGRLLRYCWEQTYWFFSSLFTYFWAGARYWKETASPLPCSASKVSHYRNFLNFHFKLPGDILWESPRPAPSKHSAYIESTRTPQGRTIRPRSDFLKTIIWRRLFKGTVSSRLRQTF